MFLRESCTEVQMVIAGICVERHQAKYSCCIRRTSQLAGECLELSWATSFQEDTVLSNRPLLQKIGSLIEPAPAETAEETNPGELLTGEGDPGLSLTGGSGHA
jgi:hypothetical protein